MAGETKRDVPDETMTAALAEAWEAGHRAGSHTYWHHPRNPYDGRMNDADPDDYCPGHGGTGTVDECSWNPSLGNQPCPGSEYFRKEAR